jgi:acetyltransferase-like isoleucine patch superfamily enzyme
MLEHATGRIDVPFLDLGCVHAQLKPQILEDISELLDSGAFTNGPAVGEFEQAFAAYCGRSACVGVANGTDAIRLSLIAAGITPGDEVIVPANTFVATFEAICQAGGLPVPVDVTEADYNVDVAAAESAVTEQTRFLLPVHLYGQLADMAGLERLAERAGTEIVEDACQAHGATRDGRRAGGVGTAAAFSFYPGKNLGAIGDAGAIVLDDADLDRELRALREHGQHEKYRHAREGWTARLDTLQAAVLLRKLPLLDDWNAERRATTGRSPASAISSPRRSRRGASRCGTCIRSAPCGATSSPRSFARGGSASASTIPSRRTSRRPTAGSDTARAASPSRNSWPASCSRCRSTPASPRSFSGPSSKPSRRSSMAESPSNDAPFRLIDDVVLGERVVVHAFTNLYGCRIGDDTRIGTFVEIQRGAIIGARCKISSHSFVCDGVTIEDEVFVGHGVIFVNDKVPRATTRDGGLQTTEDWTLLPTVVERGASLGSGAVVLGGLRIGAGALVGAGAVVTRDVAPGEVVLGNPARVRAAAGVP